MRFNIIITLLLFTMQFEAYSQGLVNSNNQSVIVGEIHNTKNIYLLYSLTNDNKSSRANRIKITKKQFLVKCHPSLNTRVKLFATDKNNKKDTIFNLLIAPVMDTIEVFIDGNNLQNLSINSNKTKAEKLKYDELKQEIENEKEVIYLKEKILGNLAVNYSNNLSSIKIEDSLKVLQIIKSKIDSLSYQIDVNFIRNNLKSFVSLEILNFRIYRRPYYISIDSILSIYESLSPFIKESKQGIEVKRNIVKHINSSKGKSLPQFSLLKNATNKLINSKDFFSSSKLTIVDFWASWCEPCREDFNDLKEVFKKNKKNGLNIISISIDRDSIAYKEALQKENLPWSNYLITKEINNIFFIPSVPYKYLINNKSEIIKIYKGGGIENMENLKKFIQQYLSNDN